MDYKLDIKIMAVRSRQQYAERIANDIGISYSNIIYDDRGINGGGNAWYNAKRAWTQPIESEITHRLVVQDDVMVCSDFKGIANILINTMPNVCFTLSGGTWIEHSMKKTNSPYIRHNGGKVCANGIILPVNHIQKMIDWSDNLFGSDYPHDDGRVGFYCAWNKLDVVGTIPSLLCHTDVATCIPHHNCKKRISHTWVGKDIGNPDWSDVNLNESPFRTNYVWMDKSDSHYDNVNMIQRIIKERYNQNKRGK